MPLGILCSCHMGKDQRMGAFVYFGHMSSFMIFFLFLHENVCFRYSLETEAPYEYPQHMFSWKNKKTIC